MFQDSNQWRPCHISPTFFNKKRSAVTFTALSSPQLLSGSGRHVQTDVTWHHMLDWLQRYLEQSISCQGHLDERGTKTRGSSFVWKTRTFWKHDHLTTSQSMCFESANIVVFHACILYRINSHGISWDQRHRVSMHWDHKKWITSGVQTNTTTFQYTFHSCLTVLINWQCLGRVALSVMRRKWSHHEEKQCLKSTSATGILHWKG